MKSTFKIFLIAMGLIVLSTSCLKDLDREPIDPDELVGENAYDDPSNYKKVLSKLYAGLATTGQQGPAGDPDIIGIDEGFGQYLRGYWYHQELTTDEAIIAWNDQTIKDFHWHEWGAGDVFVAAMYYRIFYQVSACNEFIRQTTDSKLDERGVSGDLRTEIEFFRAEARFLRALSYWHALDLFGTPPFVIESDPVGAFYPPQTNQTELFDFIESELLAIQDQMVPARQLEYGRADQAAAWMLLAKLYLNAETYINQSKYTECLENCNKIISAGYSLVDDYSSLFKADNNNLSEVIFPIVFDGLATQTYGGTTFIVHAAVGGSMDPDDFGIDGGWGGTRTTSALVNKFEGSRDTDSRAMFYTDGQNLEIEDVSLFTDGYAVSKWSNLTSEGSFGSNATFMDTDFPMFRLADVYLMYAEAVVQGGGGDLGTAISYINELRERAYGDNSANITTNDLNMDFILDERARELYWECHRRTDLIRHGKFTSGDYLWPWKGNIAQGRGTDDKFNLFPLPSSDVNANPNLSQTTGY